MGYESNMLAFCKAGGVEPPDEERRAQPMKILPSDTSIQMQRTADDAKIDEDLIDWMTRR